LIRLFSYVNIALLPYIKLSPKSVPSEYKGQKTKTKSEGNR